MALCARVTEWFQRLAGAHFGEARKGFPVGKICLLPDSAFVDVGSEKLHVSIAGGPPEVFGTVTAELHRLRDWLKSQQARGVAMEATGVYWLPLYSLLEAAGFVVTMVNGKQTRRAGASKRLQHLQNQQTGFGLCDGGTVQPGRLRTPRRGVPTFRFRCVYPNLATLATCPPFCKAADLSMDSSGTNREAVFVTTHWSLVLSAQEKNSSGSLEALEALCRAYWYPLYAFARLQGHVNPALMNLRLMQSLTTAQNAGNTLVVGVPGGFVPLKAGKSAPEAKSEPGESED